MLLILMSQILFFFGRRRSRIGVEKGRGGKVNGEDYRSAFRDELLGDSIVSKNHSVQQAPRIHIHPSATTRRYTYNNARNARRIGKSFNDFSWCFHNLDFFPNPNRSIKCCLNQPVQLNRKQLTQVTQPWKPGEEEPAAIIWRIGSSGLILVLDWSTGGSTRRHRILFFQRNLLWSKAGLSPCFQRFGLFPSFRCRGWWKGLGMGKLYLVTNGMCWRGRQWIMKEAHRYASLRKCVFESGSSNSEYRSEAGNFGQKIGKVQSFDGACSISS